MNRSVRGRLPRLPPWLPAAVLVVLLGVAAGGYEALYRHQGHPAGPARARAAVQAPARPGATPGGAAQGGAHAIAGTAAPALPQVVQVIRQSAVARAAVLRVVDGVNACTVTPVSGMRVVYGAIRRRERALNRLSAVGVGAIPGGRAMSAELGLALRESIAADQDFIAWMQDIQAAGCPVRPGHDLSYQAGLRASARAAADKRAFLVRWNRLARQGHQPVFTAGQI